MSKENEKRKKNTYNFMLPPLKKEGILFCTCWLVGLSVRRASDVHSIVFDPFAWMLLNLVQWIPLESRYAYLFIQVTWSKVKVKLLVFEQMMSVQFRLTPSMESCQNCLKEKIAPFDFQVTWSKAWVKLQVFVQMMSAQYLLIPLLKSCHTWYSECL